MSRPRVYDSYDVHLYESGYADGLVGGMCAGGAIVVILYVAVRFGAAFAGGHFW